MANRDDIWELKQTAKWSLIVSERIDAIKELSSISGMEAIAALSEVQNTTAYEEIRRLCVDAIKSCLKQGNSKTPAPELPLKRPRTSKPSKISKAEKSGRRKRHGRIVPSSR